MPCLMCVKYGRVSTRSVLHQCDQMTRLFAQYLAIYNNGILPKRIKIFPKLVQHFARHKINPQEMAQIFPKVAKFHQIWSHCSFFLSNLPMQLFCPRLEEVKNGERERLQCSRYIRFLKQKRTQGSQSKGVVAGLGL